VTLPRPDHYGIFNLLLRHPQTSATGRRHRRLKTRMVGTEGYCRTLDVPINRDFAATTRIRNSGLRQTGSNLVCPDFLIRGSLEWQRSGSSALTYAGYISRHIGSRRDQKVKGKGPGRLRSRTCIDPGQHHRKAVIGLPTISVEGGESIPGGRQFLFRPGQENCPGSRVWIRSTTTLTTHPQRPIEPAYRNQVAAVPGLVAT